MHRIKSFLISKPVFLYLLPVFFVLHGFVEYSHPVLIKDALELLSIYIGISVLLSLLFLFLYRNFYKANLIAFMLMAYNFFFGSAHDTLKKHLSDSLFVKYSFILPSTLILFVILIFVIKKSSKSFTKTAKFLNLLLLIFILVDIVNLVFTMSNKTNANVVDLSDRLVQCDTCSRPDIYLLIADEYPGKATLKTFFSFNNSLFENELQKRGFHIVNNSVSNYNHTYYSLASMLSMDYLNLEKDFTNHRDMLTCGSLINDNNAVSFLKENGYIFYNYSFFEFAGMKNVIENPFFSTRKKLITSQTFINRVQKDIGYHFSSNKLVYSDNIIESLLKKTASAKSTTPKFVYTHLNMPHHPYYFDRYGNPQSPITDEYKYHKAAFLEYLLYTNNKILQLIDHIKMSSEAPPIIIIMSDHGFRQFPNFNSHEKYHFMNFNSVYLPNKNYSGFYDGMSNVNQFRVLLNSQFGQRLPLLKDSSSFLKE